MAVDIREQQRAWRTTSGQSLRLLLVQILSEAGGTLAISDLIARCEAEGVVFESRASKLISDTLRWETKKGRVVRVARGRYRFGRAPRSTRWWLRQKVHALRLRLGQLRREDRDNKIFPRASTPAQPTGIGAVLLG